VVAPVLHKYVLPPAAVNVVLTPLQIVVMPLILGVGIGLTVTACVAVDVQLLALVTVTVYVAFDVGLTVMAAIVAPVLHKYVPPPVAVNVVEPPLQTIDVPVMLAVGSGLTVTVLVAVDVQPLALVTVTVYVASAVGLTGIVAVVTPVLHKYVPPPVAVKFVLPPLQITFVPVIVAVGNGFTVTACAAVAVQLLPLVTVTV
jgi:hypothetical protein